MDGAGNSWTRRLHEISMTELIEVQLVNAVAPAVLAARLKPLLARGGDPMTYIVNVAASEGQFALPKQGVHAHTNMAKAALNMLTHSIAAEYAAEGICVNSVDPGWVSLQAPTPHTALLEMPLDATDAAARICDPIWRGVLDGEYLHGTLLKDFMEAAW